MKTFIVLTLTLLSAQFAQASHLIGGYVQAKPVAGSTLTYEITVALYMDQVLGTAAANQATSVSVCFGDGTSGLAPRQTQDLILNRTVSLCLYRITHVYAVPSTYALNVAISNRTIANNIPNANTLLMTLNTVLSTNVVNQTPTPGFPETGFRIAINQRMALALKATDVEGDSLVYSLAKPTTSPNTDGCTNQPIAAYQFPNDVTRQGIFRLNNQTGELVWDAPTQQGNYSVALMLLEYRNGVLISQTTQEILLVAVDLPGTPSVIPPYQPAILGVGGLVTGIPNYVDSDITLTTFPNPVNDNLQLLIQSSNLTKATVQLTDVNGRKLHELQFIRPSRKHEQVISMDSLTPGIYLLKADVDGRSLVRKIVKK